MLDDKEESENRLKELEAKLEELQEFVEETGASIEDIEDSLGDEKANMFAVDQGSPPFQVHWIKPEETTSFADCDAITSVKDAQKAFKEAAEYRDESVKRVLHGDVLFLLCNKAPEPEADPNDPSNTPERGVCYYIGMCVKISTVQMKKDPDSTYDDLTSTIETSTGEPNREFFAWDSCGAASADPCDREEEYVTVVTASKVEVETTGAAPEKTHTIQGYEKTKELQFDECGTLVSVGTETDWTATGEAETIKECCDACESLEGKPSSYTVNLINSSDPALTQSSVMVKNTETCRYEDTTNNRFLTLSGGTWTLQAFSTTQTKPENVGPVGIYLNHGFESLTVSA